MKLALTNSRFVFGFGVNMADERRADPYVISWDDRKTGTWIPAPNNEAGSFRLLRPIPHDVTVDDRHDCITLYGSDGFKIVLTYVGCSFVWALREVHKVKEAA